MTEKTNRANGGKAVSSRASTIAFLCLTALLLYGMARLIGFAFSKERPDANERVPELSAQSAEPTAAPADTPDAAKEASVILLPTISPSPVAVSTPEPMNETVRPEETASPSPVPLMNVVQGTFGTESADLLCIGNRGDGSLYSLSVAHLRKNRCTIVSIPINLIDGSGAQICTATDRTELMTRLQTVYPVAFSYYFALDVSGTARCIDTVGGVKIGGQQYSGEEATAYITAEGSDEMVRISRQQTAMDAYFSKMQAAGLLQLAASKSAIQNCMQSNLSITQYLQLFQASRRIEPKHVTYRILPVDSMVVDGERCYHIDPKLVNELITGLFEN